MNVICIYKYTCFTFSERNAYGSHPCSRFLLGCHDVAVWSKFYARCYRLSLRLINVHLLPFVS